ncbi:toll-like receptor 5 [Amphiprion ocellaris]|uniref:toll-like receptor 5 n=1 Tax=Amphiprion ocellaris TaxID=80972 RepID=UPI001649E72B|nr:toll-like receptor 5 [Amphiprion ocellaris]
MWLLVLQLLGAGFYLQVATCYRSCILNGQRALCSGQWFYQVPALPPNITHLFLDRNYIRELSSASLEDFAELQDLDLGNQKVKLVIRNNGFLQQRNMTRLVLGFNIGLQLEPRAFAGLDNLQSLFLDHCRLTDAILTNSFLQPLRFLETLDLFGNRIMRLQPDGWCLEAFSLAQGRMLEELKNILIMVVVGKVTHYQLMKVNAIRAFVKRRDYLVWPEDPQDLDWFYERLFSQILKDIKVKEFEEDKPEPEVELDVEDGMELENMGAVAM